jgi:hypothetical protein
MNVLFLFYVLSSLSFNNTPSSFDGEYIKKDYVLFDTYQNRYNNQFIKAELNTPELVTEYFIIESIEKNGFVYGYLATGTGEGIYYEKEYLLKAGLKHVTPGDKIAISWKKTDYDNSNWDYIFNAKNIDK